MRFTACRIQRATARMPNISSFANAEFAFKPKSLHHIRAAAVPLAALTAWQALFDARRNCSRPARVDSRRQRRSWSFAVQLAKWKGAHVFATASTKNQELLRELGVDEPIDYTQQKFEDVVRDVDHRPRHSWRRNAGTLLVSFEKGRCSRFVSPAAIGRESRKHSASGLHFLAAPPERRATGRDREDHRLGPARACDRSHPAAFGSAPRARAQ